MDTQTSSTSQEEQPNQNTVSAAGIPSVAPTSQFQVPSSYKDQSISGPDIEMPSGSKPKYHERNYGLTGIPGGAGGILPSDNGRHISRILSSDVKNTLSARSGLQNRVGVSVAPKLDAMRVSEPYSAVPDDTAGKGLFSLPSEDDFDANTHNLSKKAQEVNLRLSPAKEIPCADDANALKKNQTESKNAGYCFDLQLQCSKKEEEGAKIVEKEDQFFVFSSARPELIQALSATAKGRVKENSQAKIQGKSRQSGVHALQLPQQPPVLTLPNGQQTIGLRNRFSTDLQQATPNTKPALHPTTLSNLKRGSLRKHSKDSPLLFEYEATARRNADIASKHALGEDYREGSELHSMLSAQEDILKKATTGATKPAPAHTTSRSSTASAQKLAFTNSKPKKTEDAVSCPTAANESRSATDVVTIEDSDGEDASVRTTADVNTNRAKRPRSPMVIDLDDDTQLQSISALPPLARRRRHFRPRVKAPGLLSSGTEVMQGTTRLQVSQGGGLFSVDSKGTVNIVDSDDEAEMNKHHLLVSTPQGIASLPANRNMPEGQHHQSLSAMQNGMSQRFVENKKEIVGGTVLQQTPPRQRQEPSQDALRTAGSEENIPKSPMALGFRGTKKISFTSSNAPNPEVFGGLPPNAGATPQATPAFELPRTENGREPMMTSTGYPGSASLEREGLSEQGLQNLIKQNGITADATVEAETPEGLTVSLMPHQKRALAWMIKREKPIHSDEDLVAVEDECLGGILADDQGLGKTVTMIALLLHGAEQAAEESDSAESNSSSSYTNSESEDDFFDDDDDFIDDEEELRRLSVPWRTLIVCPPSVISQWKEELIARTTASHKPRVCVYHGPKRVKSASRLSQYDVVLTTYATLVKEYPKVLKNHPEWAMRKAEKLEPPCRPRGPICQMDWTRVVLDESQYVKNRSTESWNAVMSLHAEKRWCLSGTPIQNCVDDLYALFCFIRYRFVRNYEMWNTLWKKKLESPFEHVRKRAFKQFQAITGVVLLRRTKLDEIDGKPLINLPSRTTEVRQLSFDRADESSFYQALEKKTVIRFNKFLAEGSISANYSNILLLLLRLRQASSHPFLIHYAQMQTRGHLNDGEDTIYSTTYSPDELEEAMELAFSGHSLLEFVEEEYREMIAKFLEPGPTGTVAPAAFLCAFCRAESLWKQGTVLPCGEIICSNCCREVQRRGSCLRCGKATAGRDSTETFLNVDHMRREVHAQAILGSSVGKNVTATEFKKLLKEEVSRRRKNQSRNMSSDDLFNGTDDDDIPLSVFIENDQRDSRTESKGVTSSSGESVSQTERRNEQSRKRLLEAISQHSTKVRVIIEELDKVRDRGEGEKTLIFSQWTSMLDIVEFHARVSGHETCRLDGSMTVSARQRQIEEFRNSPTKNAFLISLHAGGTGLNLTVSNRVILCDVWWNPAVEEQAIDRVHRIGQTRPVHVIRFLMKGTVEEKIYKICEKKRGMASGTLGEKGKQNFGRTKLARHELMSLFSSTAAGVARHAGDDRTAADAARNIRTVLDRIA